MDGKLIKAECIAIASECILKVRPLSRVDESCLFASFPIALFSRDASFNAVIGQVFDALFDEEHIKKLSEGPISQLSGMFSPELLRNGVP